MFTTTLSVAQSCSADTSQLISRNASHSLRQWKDRRFFLPMVAILALCCCAMAMSAPLQAQNIINTVAGGGVPPGTATKADIPSPSAVVEDGSGNIFISPPDSYYIFKVTSSGSMMFTQASATSAGAATPTRRSRQHSEESALSSTAREISTLQTKARTAFAAYLLWPMVVVVRPPPLAILSRW